MTDALWQRQRAYLDGITGDKVLQFERILREQSPSDDDILSYLGRDLVERLDRPVNACLVDIATMEEAALEITRLRALLAAATLNAAQPQDTP
jgi:hypothetical protein